MEGQIDDPEGVLDDESMKSFEDGSIIPIKDELYICLNEALDEDIVPISSSSTAILVIELESHMKILTFERDQARVLM